MSRLSNADRDPAHDCVMLFIPIGSGPPGPEGQREAWHGHEGAGAWTGRHHLQLLHVGRSADRAAQPEPPPLRRPGGCRRGCWLRGHRHDGSRLRRRYRLGPLQRRPRRNRRRSRDLPGRDRDPLRVVVHRRARRSQSSHHGHADAHGGAVRATCPQRVGWCGDARRRGPRGSRRGLRRCLRQGRAARPCRRHGVHGLDQRQGHRDGWEDRRRRGSRQRRHRPRRVSLLPQLEHGSRTCAPSAPTG